MKQPKRVAMNRVWKLHGIPTTFSRSIVGWVGVLGPFYAIHVRQVGKWWFAFRPRGQEYIGKGCTATAAILQAKAYYDRHIAKLKAFDKEPILDDEPRGVAFLGEEGGFSDPDDNEEEYLGEEYDRSKEPAK